MKHLILAGVAVVVAIAVSLILSIWGSHGPLGTLAVYLGYPGGFANWKLNPGRTSYTLTAAVNGVCCFACLELLLAIKSRRTS